MSAGRRNTYVTLAEVPSDATPSTFAPAGIWIDLRPSAPGAFDEQRASHLAETDYHPQITTNTFLTLDDGRQLFVRGIQDVDNRHVTHVLYCEEVLQP